MVGDASWARENVFSSILRLMREDGVLSSFSGLTAMLAKQVPYTMAKQVSFDLVAAQLYAVAAHLAVSKESAKLPVSLSAAFLASILACLASQPGDMILTATYQGKGAHGHVHEHVHSSDCAHGGVVGDKVDGFSSVGSISSKGFGSIVAGIYRQHGLAGFYLGVQARLAHVASIITSQLVVYDLLKIALGLPLTGSH